jgi:hypothetical protein
MGPIWGLSLLRKDSGRVDAPGRQLVGAKRNSPFLKTLSAAAWVFAIFRVLHSVVHCTFNLVMLRFYLYLVSALALWFMLARAAFAHFGG